MFKREAPIHTGIGEGLHEWQIEAGGCNFDRSLLRLESMAGVRGRSIRVAGT